MKKYLFSTLWLDGELTTHWVDEPAEYALFFLDHATEISNVVCLDMETLESKLYYSRGGAE